MDVHFSSSIPKSEKKPTPITASADFSGLLDTVVSRNMTHAILATGRMASSHYRDQKNIIENGEGIKSDDEENESIYQTVKKVEKKIIKLARLERQINMKYTQKRPFS